MHAEMIASKNSVEFYWECPTGAGRKKFLLTKVEILKNAAMLTFLQREKLMYC
jgi:hypothetical protein